MHLCIVMAKSWLLKKFLLTESLHDSHRGVAEEVVALVVEEVVMATLCATAATGSLSLQIKILAWLHWTWSWIQLCKTNTTGLNQLQGRAILLVSVLREMEAILVEVEEEFATDVTGEWVDLAKVWVDFSGNNLLVVFRPGHFLCWFLLECFPYWVFRPGHIARECPEGEGGSSGRGGGAVCYRCDRQVAGNWN